jgi:hypothetical protein
VEVTALAEVLNERHRLSLQHGGDRNNPQHFVRADEKHPHRLQVDHGIVQDNCASSTNNRFFQTPPVHVARAAGSMVVVVREGHQGHQDHAIAHFEFDPMFARSYTVTARVTVMLAGIQQSHPESLSQAGSCR